MEPSEKSQENKKNTDANEDSAEKDDKKNQKLQKLYKQVAIAVGKMTGNVVLDKWGNPIVIGIAGRSKFYARVVSERDQKMILVTIDKDNVVSHASMQMLEVDIHNVVVTQLASMHPSLENISAQTISGIAKTALLEMKIIPSEVVSSIKLFEDKGYAFERLPWTLENVPDTPTPWFDRVLKQIETNRDAVELWVGSLFDMESDRSQYLYLAGGGNDGKGRLIHVLKESLGSAAITAQPPGDDDRWFFGNVYDKRLVIFSDIDNYKVCSSQKIKTLTGDDYVPAEKKGENVFQAKVNCKVLFASNKDAGIGAGTADQRRIILCEMESVIKKKEDGTLDYSDVIAKNTFDEGLKSEAQVFFARCLRKYREVYPSHDRIEVDQTAAQRIADSNDAEFIDMLENHFVIHPELYVTYAGLRFVGEKLRMDSRKLSGFRNWLKAKKKLRHELGKLKGNRTPIRAIWGIGVKPEDSSPEYGSAGQPARSGLSEIEYAGQMKKLGYPVSRKSVRGSEEAVENRGAWQI